MSVLIIGASSRKSIGFFLGEFLKSKGYLVYYASRTGKQGLVCDVSKYRQVSRVINKVRPQIIVYAAGVFIPPAPIGSIRITGDIKEHLSVKGLGMLNVLEASVTAGCVECLIALGGRQLPSNSGFAAYSIGNGSLWASVKFASHHTKIASFYIDLPLIANSNMGIKYLKLANITRPNPEEESTEIERMKKSVLDILSGKHKNGSRIRIPSPRIISGSFGI